MQPIGMAQARRSCDPLHRSGLLPGQPVAASALCRLSDAGFVAVERGAWWFHIVGILAFPGVRPLQQALPHFLAFPNTWYSDLTPAGSLDNMAAVKKEVDLMMSGDPLLPLPNRAG